MPGKKVAPKKIGVGVGASKPIRYKAGKPSTANQTVRAVSKMAKTAARTIGAGTVAKKAKAVKRSRNNMDY